jgi:DHA1 family bicyclomycin/chloramphenicol resistance-like MFS transporter
VADRGGASRPLLVVLLGLATAIGPLSIDTHLPALPAMAADLGVAPGQAQLSLTTCLVGLAAGQLAAGALSDRWGRRRPLVAGLAAYAVLSFLIALAPSAPMLIALRFLQGLAGGTGVAIPRAVVRDLFAGAAAARFFSRLALVSGLAPILAPSLGSAVLRVSSWRGIFVTLGGIGLLVTALLAARLPETLPPARRTGGGLRTTARTAGPILADRVFLGYAVAQALAFSALFAYLANGSFVQQQGYGLSPTVFGLLFGLNAIGITAFSQANARLLDRVSPRTLLLAALAGLTVAGVVTLAAALLGSLIGLLAGLLLLTCAFGMTQPNSIALAMDRHPDRAGTASSVLGPLPPVLSAALAPLAALGPPGRGVPMAALMLGCAAAALLCVLLLTGERALGDGSPRRSGLFRRGNRTY